MKVALIGWGTVAKALYQQIQYRKEIEVKKVLIRSHHPCSLEFMTWNYQEILDDCEIETVVDMIPSADAAYEYCRKAMEAGKSVVTSNKAMMAAYFNELNALAKKKQVSLRYDASVAGGIPWLRTVLALKNSDPLIELEGIFNGTTNYILDKMEEDGITLEQGISQAQHLGYAEADPSADIDGLDVVRKLMISGACAMNQLMREDQIYTEGIRQILPEDIKAFASRKLHCRLVATLKQRTEGLQAEIEPTLLSQDHPLSGIHRNLNACTLQTAQLGSLTLIGQGAGGAATAHAVLTDILREKEERCPYIQAQPAMMSRKDPMVHYYIGTDEKTAPLFKKVQKEQYAGRKRTVIWTGAVRLSEIRDLIRKGRESDPGLFAARIKGEE